MQNQLSIALHLLCILSCLFTGGVNAQIPSGSWRDHLPYSHASRLAEYDNRIFCATSDGSLFSYDLRNKNIKKHSKVNGLSDAGITAIGHSQATQTFFIGYSNGNIDLIRNDSIYNLPDVKRKMIVGEKSINQVFFLDRYAYLACGFGIILCDLSRREIKDTYLFGPGGTQLFVNDITSDGTFLYAATRQGIFKASLNHPNLLDFNAWEKLTQLPDQDAEYKFLAWYDNRLFTVYTNTVSGNDDIITVSSSGWTVWEESYADHFAFLGNQGDKLVFCGTNKSMVYGSNNEPDREVVSFYALHLLIDAHEDLWYAGSVAGLVQLDEAGNGTVIVPDGPAYSNVGDIEILSGNLWAGGGTINSQWSGYGAYAFMDEKWTVYNQSTIPEMKDFLNISEISIDPGDPDHIIGGSYGFGVAEFQNGELVAIEDETGGVLKPVTGYENQPGYVRVMGTDINAEGIVYISTSESEWGVYRKKKGAEWEVVPLEYEDFGFTTHVGELLTSSLGQQWVLIESKGLLVFTDNDNEVTAERFFTVRNQEGQWLDQVYAIAEDKEGIIWVGTNKGPVLYPNPEEVFESESVTGYQPTVPRNDGTNFVSLLLATEKINDIEVDGANQKWLATEKSGVFLVSPDGKKEIHHFTAENSPLFSNKVLTIAVDDLTGEVYFGTEIGMVSFRGQATEGKDDFDKVYVFPNPVRETFTGDITITGLVGDVDVKITDITGNLVFETTSLGGQAIWDGRNFSGERVHTGVYLVFCSNEDGSKTHITKLLFIH